MQTPGSLETSAVWLVADADACVAGGAMRLMGWLSRRAFPLGLEDQLCCASRGPSCRRELGIWGQAGGSVDGRFERRRRMVAMKVRVGSGWGETVKRIMRY